MNIVIGTRVRLPSNRIGVVKTPDFNGRAVVRYELAESGQTLKEWMSKENEVAIHRELLREVEDAENSAG